MINQQMRFSTNTEREEIKSNRWAQFKKHSWKLGGAAEHLLNGSEKRFDRFILFYQGPILSI